MMACKRPVTFISQCICQLNVKYSRPFILGCTAPQRSFSTSKSGRHDTSVKGFELKKVVLMRKITRYQYEKQWHPHFSEEELKDFLTKKGSDYDGLVQRHKEYYQVLNQVHEHLIKRDVKVEVVQRFDYHTKSIDWADAIITVGGDGTFLMAASKIKGHGIPVIGINADPERSEGYLCLPRDWSLNFTKALDKILKRDFRWMWRQRLRLTMSGKHVDNTPVDLHKQELQYPEHRFLEHVKEHELMSQHSSMLDEKPPSVLPILALNEVFIGESLSARVSFYEISVDGSERVKQKSSGITICTGTGSTSWFFNINHLPKQSVRRILSIAKDLGQNGINIEDELLIRKITKEFNNSLTFDAGDTKMAYVVRDPVAKGNSVYPLKGIFQVNNPRGFCKHMSVKSRMWDAWVVVDGGISFKFNDGAIVDLQISDDDALRCVTLD